MIWPDPTHQPTKPPTHPPKPHTHSWVRNSSQISNLQTELKYLDKLKRYQILSDSGGPPLGGWRMGGWGGSGYGSVGGCPMHTYMHTYAHTYTHTHTCMLNMLNMLSMDASMLAAICNFYTCINVCVCACMHMHVRVCGDTLPCPQMPPPTCTLPRATGSPKHQNSLTLELIEIIQFCLKILYLWTFLNSYRL